MTMGANMIVSMGDQPENLHTNMFISYKSILKIILWYWGQNMKLKKIIFFWY
jgi:hypothetical protein